MKNEHLQETRKQQSSPVWNTAKLKPGVTLYIQNIHMPVGCDRTGVRNMVMEYANRDNDPTAAIRIKKGTVITNHRCDDVVGCRNIVSEDDAKKSQKPGYWPNGKSCRRWEDRPPGRDMQQTRYRGQEPRSSRYFYRRDTDDKHYAGSTRQAADNKNSNIRQRRDIVDKSEGVNGHARCVDLTDFQYSRISSDIPW